MEFELLPTGKQHISFSELKDWKECSWRHKLKNIDKIDIQSIGPALSFGTAVHNACENYLKTKVMDFSIAEKIIVDSFNDNLDNEKFKNESKEKMLLEARSILNDVPNWLDSTFPNWECLDAEYPLYEKIDNVPYAFKGFVDAILICDKQSKNSSKIKKQYWVLDWKTSTRGWMQQKKRDELTKSQAILYKEFISRKLNIPKKDIMCGFVILKRYAKPSKHCELFKVSAGDVTIKKSLKVVNNMITTLNRKIALKNRESCTYCDYKGTEWCT